MIRVLVVDDKDDNLYYLDVLLRSQGYEVETAQHGAEALAKARNRPPGLIVSDLLMPIMDGYTLLRHWKADPQLRAIPFIVYTATYTTLEDENLAVNLGADAFILKPAEPEDFVGQVRRVLADARSGATRTPQQTGAADDPLVRQYSAALVRKLEEKTLQLEASNRALEKEISERNRMAATQGAILDALPAHVALLDRSGTIVTVNGSWRRFVSADGLRSPDFQIGANFLDICAAVDGGRGGIGAIVAEAAREVLAGRRSQFEAEYPSETAGDMRWFRLILTPLQDSARGGALVTHVEVTDRKVREAEVEDITTRLERLIAEAPIGIIVQKDLKPIMANEKLAAMFGYASKEDILALDDCSVLFAGEDGLSLGRYGRARPRSEGAPNFHAAKGVKADGSLIDLENRAFAIPWGGAMAVCGMITDVTDQRRLEEQLRQSQRLEAIGQMTGGVAHDFNNLLTVILGNAELLEDSLADTPRLRRLAELTRAASERAAELTSRLLSFSRKQPLDPKPIDIRALLADLQVLIRRSVGEQVEVRTVAPNDLWPALIDAPQLENAVLNLAVNARDAMPNGGRLTIEASNALILDAVTGQEMELRPGAYVAITVADTGVGMDEETRLHAFDPFFTTKDVGKGSGLGLSMVYGFAKQSRGHVHIISAPGRGTTVTLHLPRAMVQASDAAARRDATIPGGSERVLVVEDDDLVRGQVTANLAALGYDVVTARDAHEALDALGSFEDVRLLFTDVVMPRGMNGRQLAEAAMEINPGLVVLYTSGYAEDALIHNDRLDENVHLLVKPYRRRDLAAKVRQVLDMAGRRRPP